MTKPTKNPSGLHPIDTQSTFVGDANGAVDDNCPRDDLAAIFQGQSDASGPPKKNGTEVQMTKEEVERRIAALSGHCRRFLSDSSYAKLAWLVGKDVDLEILKRATFRRPVWWHVYMILSERSKIGKQYQALYVQDGDQLFDSLEEGGIPSLECILETKLPKWNLQHPDTKDMYTVFHDPDHPNVTPLLQVQQRSNCYVHAAATVRRLKGLWCHPEVSPESADFVHISKFQQNILDGRELYNYIFLDEGGYSQRVMMSMFPELVLNCGSYVDSLDCIKNKLKTHGAGVISVKLTNKFHDDSFEYMADDDGTRDEGNEGHVLVLVGIRLDKSNDVHFLFQNSWRDKPFVCIAQKHMCHFDPQLFLFEVLTDVPVSIGEGYAQALGSTKCAISSSLLARPVKILLMK